MEKLSDALALLNKITSTESLKSRIVTKRLLEITYRNNIKSLPYIFDDDVDNIMIEWYYDSRKITIYVNPYDILFYLTEFTKNTDTIEKIIDLKDHKSINEVINWLFG